MTVLAPEVIAADVLALMVAKTEFTPERTTTVTAEFPRPRNTLIIAKVALRTDALAVMLLPLSASFVTVFTVVPASEESGHSGDEVIMTILQQQIDFLHSGGLLFWRPCNNGTVVLERFNRLVCCSVQRRGERYGSI